MPRFLLSIAAILALALAACGGGSSPTPSPSPSPTIDFGAAARQAVSSALMTIADLPEFWAEGGAGDTNVDLDLSPACDIFDPDVAFPDSVAVEQSAVFLGRDERQASFTTAVFREEEDARAAFAGQADLVERCHDEFLEVIEQAARDQAAERGFPLGPLARVSVALEPINFPSLEDDTSARRARVAISLIGVTVRFDADIIVVRSGRVMGAMTYSNFESIDLLEEETIARTMATKLAAADSSLPE